MKINAFQVCDRVAQSSIFTDIVKEGHTNVLVMDHHDPDAVDAMLRYLYTGNYNTEGQTMQFHLQIYELADKVRIPTLKTLSEDKFKAMAEND